LTCARSCRSTSTRFCAPCKRPDVASSPARRFTSAVTPAKSPRRFRDRRFLITLTPRSNASAPKNGIAPPIAHSRSGVPPKRQRPHRRRQRNPVKEHHGYTNHHAEIRSDDRRKRHRRMLKKEGDKVNKGDILFTVETDKSVMEVESFEVGTLLKIVVPPHVNVPVQSTVGFLGNPGEPIPAVAAPAPAAPQPAVAAAPRRGKTGNRAHPLQRRFPHQVPLQLFPRRQTPDPKRHPCSASVPRAAALAKQFRH